MACEPKTITVGDVSNNGTGGNSTEEKDYQSDFSPQQVETAVKTALESGLPTAVRLRDLYESFLQNREPGCPDMEVQNSETWQGVWFDDCATSSGYYYWGTAIFFETEEDGLWDFNAVLSFELWDPAGYRFVGGGEFESSWDDQGDTISWFSRTGGTFQYAPYGGFFSHQGETSLFLDAQIIDSQFSGQLDGGVAFDSIYFYFDAVTLSPDTCGGLPQGEVLIRDGSDLWFSLALTDCSGCGDLMWQQQKQGEICLGTAIRDAVQVMQWEMESY